MRGDIKAHQVFDVFEKNRANLLDREWLSAWLQPHCKINRMGWRGDRLRILQCPYEFADWLILLAKRGVQSYVEIGTSTGGSFMTTDSYLRATVPGYKLSLGFDRKAKMRDFEEYRLRFPTAVFVNQSSEQIRLGSHKYGAAFIDARHLEHWVLQDFEKVRGNCGIVGFHDIVLKGATVGAAWQKIKAGRDSWEFIDKSIPPEARCGIGAVEIGKWERA